MKYFGAFIGGGLLKAAAMSSKYDMNSAMIMPTAPMRWALKEIPLDIAEDFVEQIKESPRPLKKILLHGVYLINLARGDKQMFHLGKMSLVHYMNYVRDLQALINDAGIKDLEILGTCFHPGSVKDLTEEESMERVIYGLNWILDNSSKSTLLVESTAGSGAVMGDTLEELAKMRQGVEQKDRLGFVLDTQHMFASGYDWGNDLDKIVDQIDATIGLKNVKAFHLNDSMTDLASHKDRHANLGEGKIGAEAIKQLVNHPKFNEIPFIMETPGLKEEAGLKNQLETLRSYRKP